MLEAYTFSYLDAEGKTLDATNADCADDEDAIERAVRWRLPNSAIVEIWCGARVVAKRRLDNPEQ